MQKRSRLHLSVRNTVRENEDATGLSSHVAAGTQASKLSRHTVRLTSLRLALS